MAAQESEKPAALCSRLSFDIPAHTYSSVGVAMHVCKLGLAVEGQGVEPQLT